MSDIRRQRVDEPIRKMLAILGMAALAVVLPGWFVWGPLGILAYAGGLSNSMGVFVAMFYLAPLVIVGVAGFPILCVRAARTWCLQTPKQRRSLLLWIMFTGGFGIPFVLGLAGLSPSLSDLQVRGFRHYAERHTDVEIIRSWLNTLDPNDYTDKHGGTVEERFMGARLPPCMASLRPKWATVLPDERGRLMVRLLWGGGFIGHWGIVVGQEDLPTPPSDSSPWGDRYLPLGRGAYIWAGD